MEWNKLDVKLRKSVSLAVLKVGRLTAKPIYTIHNPIDSKLVTRLRLGLIHFNEHSLNIISKIV